MYYKTCIMDKIQITAVFIRPGTINFEPAAGPPVRIFNYQIWITCPTDNYRPLFCIQILAKKLNN